VRKKRTNDIYAMKVLRKSDMIQKNQEKYVKAERNILARTQNPFVIKMYYAFQSKVLSCDYLFTHMLLQEYLYLVMDYASGGDCFSLLQKFGSLPEHVAKVFILCYQLMLIAF
jgi:serine/threonine-protein kinase RIM15